MKNKVVLIHGGVPNLTRVIASTLLEREVTVALCNPNDSVATAALVAEMRASGGEIIDLTPSQSAHNDIQPTLQTLYERYGSLDAVVNLYVPTANTNAEMLMAYPADLETRIVAASNFMAEKRIEGIVINQFMLATMFADHPLAYAAAAARGAVTGLTRTACVRFGKSGVRVTGLFVGLLDLPEIKGIATERVLAATTPMGRWITANDVAESVSFLALDSGYISGQMLVLDGGMTSGINGV